MSTAQLRRAAVPRRTLTRKVSVWTLAGSGSTCRRDVNKFPERLPPQTSEQAFTQHRLGHALGPRRRRAKVSVRVRRPLWLGAEAIESFEPLGFVELCDGVCDGTAANGNRLAKQVRHRVRRTSSSASGMSSRKFGGRERQSTSRSVY